MLGTAPLGLASCGTDADGPAPTTAGSGGGSGAANATAGSMSAGAPTAGNTASGGAGAGGSLGASGSPAGGSAPAPGSGGGAGGAGGVGGSASAGQGGSGGTSTGGVAGSGQGGGGTLTLTSSKLAAGSVYSPDFTCAGDNHSPPLAWSGAPTGTLSYAMVLKDTSNMMVHWVMWDIPAATTQLNEDTPTGAQPTMPAGAKQRAGFGSTQGYQGPCPNGTSHTYVFTVYAIDAMTLPSVTTTTAVGDLVTAIMGHDVASATLTATSDAKRP